MVNTYVDCKSVPLEIGSEEARNMYYVSPIDGEYIMHFLFVFFFSRLNSLSASSEARCSANKITAIHTHSHTNMGEERTIGQN